MTSPEWEAANEDDSDRFPQTQPSVCATFTHRCNECGGTVHVIDGHTQPHEHAELSPLDGSPGVGDLLRSDPARVARYAEAIYAEGAYCGDCEYLGWDECSQCRAATLGYAKAAIALADEERAALVADFDDRLADVQDEYRKAAESWDRTRARLNEEIERLRVWIDRAEVAEAEVERMRAILDDAPGRFRESDHLIPKWAKDLRAAERRVVQLRGDVTSWQGMHREVSRRARAAEAEVERTRETSEHRAELLKDALRERDQWHDAAYNWAYFNQRRAEAAEAKLAKVEETIQREGKLHSTWDKRSEMVVPVDALRAVLADAPAEQRAEGGA